MTNTNNSIGLYFNRRMGIVLFMGFLSGFPFLITLRLLQASLKDYGVSLATLGVLALVRMPYSFKFLWAPLLDYYYSSLLGRRRTWIGGALLFTGILTILLGQLNPQTELLQIAFVSFFICFASATLDIAIDSYRIEFLTSKEYGAGATVAIFGFRIGMLLTGAVGLALGDIIPWSHVFTYGGALLLASIPFILLCPEPENVSTKPRNLLEAIFLPLKDLLQRNHIVEILIFLLTYKIGDTLATGLIDPFYKEIGFSWGEIAGYAKTVGMLAVISGGIFGGALLSKIKLKNALLWFGVLQALSIGVFALLAIVGKNPMIMIIAVASENFFIGLATSAYVTFLMNLCNKSYTAAQYALFTSLAQITSMLLTTPTGILIEKIGWPTFFVLCMALALPSLLLLVIRYEKWAIR